MRSYLKALPVVFLLSPAFADTSEEQPKEASEEVSLPQWKGSAEVGSIWTSGNTSTSSVNGKFDVVRKGENWTSKLKMSALSSKEDSKTSKEKYSGLLQLDRHFSERTYLAIVGQQDRDRFSGFQYQGTLSAGLGYRAIKKDHMLLEFEAGPGYSRERLRDESGGGADDVNEEAIARLVANYSWRISEGVSFIEEFSAEIGANNSIYRSETGLKSQINGSLATKITYKTKYVAEVPDDTKKSDNEFGVTLVYSF